MFPFMTLTLIPPKRPLPPPIPALRPHRARRSVDSGGGRIAVGRNARWRAQVQLGRLVVKLKIGPWRPQGDFG